MKTNEVLLITDSTCDIPQPLVEEHHIRVLPNLLIWGDEQYRDRVDLSPEDFYRRLQTDPRLPTTAQITARVFTEAFEEFSVPGVKEILVITLSSAMSGAHQSALQAAEKFRLPVHVIDSRAVTMSLGWQVLAAARALERGLEVPAVIETVRRVRERLVLFVCMDTMKYLSTGGRVGNARKFIGTLLDIKPIVSINHHSGIVEPVAISRTYHKAVELFQRKFFASLDASAGRMRVALTHGGVPEEAMRLAERIRAEFDPLELLVNTTGPVLGVNTGPRALALSAYMDDVEE